MHNNELVVDSRLLLSQVQKNILFRRIFYMSPMMSLVQQNMNTLYTLFYSSIGVLLSVIQGRESQLVLDSICNTQSYRKMNRN